MLLSIAHGTKLRPSNLNRDDTNNPKDCTLGGTRKQESQANATSALSTSSCFRGKTGVEPATRTRLLQKV
jgi:hypothetical protein